MATGYIGGGNNTALTYTPSSPAKLLINWYATASGNLSVNGTVVTSYGAAAGGGQLTYYVAAGVTMTITSSSASMNFSMSALEEST
jgi:hypothetical protein